MKIVEKLKNLIEKNRAASLLLVVWLICYLGANKLFNKKPLVLIGVYVVFTTAMYVGDVKCKKWGLLNKLREQPKFDLSKSNEYPFAHLCVSTMVTTLSRFIAISIAVLSLTIGYLLMTEEKDILLYFSLISPLFISIICFLFALETQSTSIAVKWLQKQKEQFDRFANWAYIIGWHAFFIYILLIIAQVDYNLFLTCILLYTFALCYYYFRLDYIE